MIFTVWALFAAITCCYHVRSSPVSPVVAALEPSSSQEFGESQDEALSSPDKRLLKYFLPEGQAWGEGAPIPFSQEGIKRGYSDKNYLRFGRNENRMPNFIRFGRSDADDDYDQEADLDDSLEKRSRNFLRFGRGPNRNFLRFGRGQNRNFLRFGRGGGPLSYGLGLGPVSEEELNEMPIQEEKRARNANFVIRYGRSVDRQLSSTFCDDCDDTQSSSSQQATTTDEPTSAHGVVSRPKRSAAKESSPSLQRSKRYVPTYYGYSMSHQSSPVSWARSMPPEDLILDEEAREMLPVKRGSNNVSDGVLMMKQYPRFVRAPQRNFLRFG